MMKYKKVFVGALATIILLLIASFLAQPLVIKAIKAKFKSTDHFLILQEDSRIRYELDAKSNAKILADVLSDAKKAVEQILKSSFEKPIGIYICASQEAFNEYVFLSKNARGAVYWGNVFLSPGAFNRGSLDELVQHELTHYLFFSHLGERAHIKNVPLWFREGVAVFVANGGSRYTEYTEIHRLMTSQERKAYLSGETDAWFKTANAQDAVTSNGVANWLLYRVSGLFVHFMYISNPNSFDSLVQKLLAGEALDVAIQSTYSMSVEDFHARFTEYLKSYG